MHETEHRSVVARGWGWSLMTEEHKGTWIFWLCHRALGHRTLNSPTRNQTRVPLPWTTKEVPTKKILIEMSYVLIVAVVT